MSDDKEAVQETGAERARIVAALEASGYVVAHAALALGASKTTLRRRIEAYGLDGLVEEHSQRVRQIRMNRELPAAPHEPSRQAQEQAANRAKGLCSCGRPPAPRRDGKPGRMCKGCRARESGKKRRATAARALSPAMKSTLGIPSP